MNEQKEHWRRAWVIHPAATTVLLELADFLGDAKRVHLSTHFLTEGNLSKLEKDAYKTT